MKTNTKIYSDLNFSEISQFLGQNKIESFRIKQIEQWIYDKLVFNFEEMTNLPKSLRNLLNENFIINPLELKERVKASDGTIKFSFLTQDKFIVESVLIDNNDRKTLCLSTQIGCPINCAFCLTGKMGFYRNLSFSEIIFQYLFIQKLENIKITNIVYMGMGEPLLNYDSVVQSLEFFISKMKISRRKVVVSTVGIIDKIYKLSELEFAPKLAVSLHSARKEIREKLVPNVQYSLDDILRASYYYYQMTQLPITFEYVVLDGINDREEDIEELINYAIKIKKAKVNLIPFNEFEGSEFKNSGRTLEIQDKLTKHGINTFIRTSFGKDAQAACGNLFAKQRSKNLLS